MQDVKQALNYIKPSTLTYQEWINVGMALKSAGYPLHFFEEWSKDDSRFKEGECYKKWQSFGNEGITLATLFFYAYERGYAKEKPKKDFSYVIPDVFPACSYENEEDARAEQVHFLTTLFGLDERINLVSDTYFSKGKFIPKNSGDTIALIDFVKHPEGLKTGDGGAWFRINPLDGKGVFNANVSAFRYALIESDKMSLRDQYRTLIRLKFPLEFIVHSGGKSLHGIVKIYAKDYAEYKQRVDFLYRYCQKQGFEVDKANKNPSRLSRLAGVKRGEHWQYIVSEACGFSTWEDWYNHVESEEKALIFEDAWGYLEEPPVKREELIEGVVRRGHKLLITASSKAGKSFLLQNLALEVCRGGYWLGRKTRTGNVLILDFEIDRSSFLNRLSEISRALDISPEEIKGRLKFCCLRGKSYDFSELIQLISEQIKGNWTPSMIIIDPLYKVLRGDENSAEVVAKFMDYVTALAEEINATVVVAHHHSKGAQGNKSSMDRGSGSGVFARDGDALLDLLQLDPSRNELEALVNEEKIKVASLTMYNKNPNSAEIVLSQPFSNNGDRLMQEAKTFFKPEEQNIYEDIVKETEYKQKKIFENPYFRVEGTLREFKNFEPFEVRFDYPTHVIVPHLKEAEAMNGRPKTVVLSEGRKKGLRTMNEEKKTQSKGKKEQLKEWLIDADEEGVPLEDIMNDLDLSNRSVRNFLKELGAYSRKGVAYLVEKLENENENFFGIPTERGEV